jgi:8-oxo-dGTP pyrophosphatase MutT (NUDIX family)
VEDSGPKEAVAAVLVLLYPDGDDWRVIFTRRTYEVASHKGEISFPGGLQEEGDLSPLDTALRETREELGIEPSLVKVLGQLEAVHTMVSGFLIHPFVGLLPSKPKFRPSLHEVAEVIEASLKRLADPSIFRTQEYVGEGRSHTLYFFDYDPDHVIWGATARILKQLVERYRRTGDIERLFEPPAVEDGRP